MSALTKTILAASIALAFGTAAYASDATEGAFRAGQGYAIDATGQPRIVDLNTPFGAIMAQAPDEQHHRTNNRQPSAPYERSGNEVYTR